jgi:nucleotide-binding universal stress UspA family protein
MMRVLLAYDASPGAAEAASLALALHWPPESAVRVVNVLEPWGTLVSAMPLPAAGLVTSPEIEAEIVAGLESDLQDLVGRLRTAGVEADGAVLRGRPGSVLVEDAQAYGADLIIAGSRGHGAIASLVLGSVSAELVDHAPCPVLVVRRATADRVLFASDGSPSATHAGKLLAEWPIFGAAAIRVVSVADVVRPWHSGLAPTMYRQVVAAHAKDLEMARTEHDALAAETADRLRTAGRTVDVSVRAGDAAAEIVDEASEWGADLIVLGSRGRTGLSRLVLGSVARNVLQGSTSSVLIVRDSAPST